MQRILVTGGTGMLGRVLVPKLQAAGYHVRVMSRKPPPPRRDVPVERLPSLERLQTVEWAQANVLTGEGLDASMQDVDMVIHGATSPLQNIHTVEVQGTQNMLEAARSAGVSHFIYVSIVGIDRTPYEYYTAKLDAERVVRQETFQRNVYTGVPWTILRGTQFYELMDGRLKVLARFPIAVIDPHMKFQPVDVREFSDKLVELAGQPAQGMTPDFGGPQVLELDEIFRRWLDAKHLRRITLKVRAPGKFAAACRQAWNTNPQQRCGTLTWSDWLAEMYPSNGIRRQNMAFK